MESTERFCLEVSMPPFAIAEVRIRAEGGEGELAFRLKAGSEREMLDSAFWSIWNLIICEEVDEVGVLDVTLRAPTFS